MEGKEVRFGTATSRFCHGTTDSSSGAVNAMRQLHAARRRILMANMMLYEVIVGGVGSGPSVCCCSPVAVFVAG
jgi:K+-transporting ATPase A subunit